MSRNIAVGIGLMEFPFDGIRGFWRWVDLCEQGGVDSLWQTDRIVSREPILEALEHFDAALYIHPTSPPSNWVYPYAYRGFIGALAGFSHEVWMHTMGLIFSGAFDKYPKLRLVIETAREVWG